MAYTPRKNMFGRAYGLKRGPSPRFYATHGIEAKGLFLSTSVDTGGSMTQVNIEDATTIFTSSTGTAAQATRGITLLATGASTIYTLAAPPAVGIRKTFATAATSTLVRQVVSASHIVLGASSSTIGADGSVMSVSTAGTVMTFNGLGQTIELLSISTAAWLNTSLRGFTSTGILPISTV